MSEKSKSLGQYFTPKNVVDFMCSLVTKEKDASILEPCAGEGIFLTGLTEAGFTNIDAFEIDKSLPNNSTKEITYGDFLLEGIEQQYEVIIGNPPYVRWKNITDEMKTKLQNDPNWKEKINGLSDLLYAFIYKSIQLLQRNGELIFITPAFWLETQHSEGVRKELLRSGSLELLINFNEMRIFNNVSSNIVIFKYRKERPVKKIKAVTISSKEKLSNEKLVLLKKIIDRLDSEKEIYETNIQAFLYPQFQNSAQWQVIPPAVQKELSKLEEVCRFSPDFSVRSKGQEIKVKLSELYQKSDFSTLIIEQTKLSKVRLFGTRYFTLRDNGQKNKKKTIIRQRFVRLGDVVEIGNGMVSGLDRAFRVRESAIFSAREKKFLIQVIKAKGLEKYFARTSFDYLFVNAISSEKELEEKFPNIFDHLVPFKDRLEKRYNYNRKIPWWHWVFPRNQKLIEDNNEKIIVPSKERFDSRGFVRFALVKGNYHAVQDTTVLVRKKGIRESLEYILAILNSEMIFTWLKHKGLKRGGVLEFSERPLSMIPMKLINWADKREVELHNIITEKVRLLISQKSTEKTKDIEAIIRKLFDC